MALTPHLKIRLMASSDLQKEVIVNEAVIVLDAFAARVAINKTNTPPASPALGDTYICNTAPTGLWAGQAGNIAVFYNGWRFYEPANKTKFYVEAGGAYQTYTAGTNTWAVDLAGSPSTLEDLTNVSGTVPTDGQVLTFDSTNGWQPENPAGLPSLDQLTDVAITTPAANAYLGWDADSSLWIDKVMPSFAADLSDLGDVAISSVETNQILMWDGTQWINADNAAASVLRLQDLDDVMISEGDLAPNDALVWNGAAWAPSSVVWNYSFIGMIDGPMTFEDHAGHFMVVNATEDAMVFMSVAELLAESDFRVQDMPDMETPSVEAIGKWLRLKADAGVYSYEYALLPTWEVVVKAGETTLTTRVLSFTFNGFDITETTEGNVTITAANTLEFLAAGVPVEGAPVSAINFTGSGVGVTNVEGQIVVTIENGGGALETLSDVDLETIPPVDGNALVYDGIAAKWVPGEGGSTIPEIDGEAFAATYELGPFAPPLAAMFPLRFNAPAPDLTFVPERGLMVQPGPQASGTRHAGIVRSLANDIAPWVITARVVPNSYTVTGHAAGLFLQRSVGEALIFIDVGQSTGDTQAVVRFGSVSNTGVETITLSKALEFYWLRMSYDGNDVRAYVSSDGLIWQLFGMLGAAGVLGGPPDRIGLENRSAASHGGGVGGLFTYYDDPDFPAASRISNGVVSLGLSGLVDVDLTTVPPEDGNSIVWDEALGKWVAGEGGGGVTALALLTDVDLVTTPPIAGNTLVYDDVSGKWVPGEGGGGAGGIATEFDLSIWQAGVPDASLVMYSYLVPRDFRFYATLDGSAAYAQTAPSSATSITLKKNGTSIGTIDWATGVNAATFTFTADVDFLQGDRLDFTAPVSLNALADVAITLTGERL